MMQVRNMSGTHTCSVADSPSHDCTGSSRASRDRQRIITSSQYKAQYSLQHAGAMFALHAGALIALVSTGT